MSHSTWQGISILKMFYIVIVSQALRSSNANRFFALSQAKPSVMTSLSRIFLFALVLSKAFANPLQQMEPANKSLTNIGVDAFPNTLRELAASPDATVNPGSLYAPGDSLDRPGSTTVTSWLALADSNGSPAALSNEIWPLAVEKNPNARLRLR